MKILVSLLAFAAAFVYVLNVVAPKNFSIEREVLIQKPRVVVYDYLRNLKNSTGWNPWMKRDPQVKVEIHGTDGTVGSVYSWSGNKEVGVGEQEIKNLVPNERIDFELRFKEPFPSTAQGYFITENGDEAGSSTKVRWGLSGSAPFPVNILHMLMNMKKMLADDFDRGLNTLKGLIER